MSDHDPIPAAGRQSGMTLVEIVVALVIVGLTFAMAAGAFRLLARSGETGTALIERHDMFSRGIDTLRRDVERLERIPLGKDGNDPQFAFGGDQRALSFVVLEPPFPTAAGLFLVRYAIVERDGHASMVRSRAPFVAAAGRSSARFGDDVTVLEGPYRFGFSYLERQDGRERWVARWSDRVSLPVLVKLDVADGASGAAVLPPLVFRPRIEVEPGCARSGSGPCTILQQKADAAPAGKEKPK